MIDPATIARIQDAAQIVEVVSDFVTLKRAGANYKGLCPFHDDRTPSFMVSPAKNICKCFSCGEGGPPVHFIMKHEQLSYPEALKYLAKKYHIEVKERELTDEEKKAQSTRDSLFILNEFARDYFVKVLHEIPEGKHIGLSYFRERGFHENTIQKFQLGYSLEARNAFSQEAQKAGYKKEFLLKTGLASDGKNETSLYDRFRGRVIFPVHTLSGKVVAFGGRILKKTDKLAKYVNSPESEIYSKSNELYGIFFAKKAIVKEDRCFLVEGYTDVISMHQAGIENVVSSSGTALTHGQIRMIRRFSQQITVLYDGDAAGIKAALRGIDLLLEEGMNVKVVLLPEGEDPDSFARKQSAEKFHQFIAKHETDFIRFKTELLLNETGADPIKRAELINNIVQSIALIPHTITRTVYVQECAKLLGVDEPMLMREVNKIRLRAYDKKKEAVKKEKSKETKQSASTEQLTSTKISAERKSPLLKAEREIVRYIVRYATTPLYRRYDVEKRKVGQKVEEVKVLAEEGPSIIQFVCFDLERDAIELTHPIYQKMLNEARANASDESFKAATYFMHHPDPEISRISVALLDDKYQLSKYHAKSIGEEEDSKDSRLKEENLLETLVPRATTELKYMHILQRQKKILSDLKKAQTADDFEQITTLLLKKKELEGIKKHLAKVLGEQVILRY